MRISLIDSHHFTKTGSFAKFSHDLEFEGERKLKTYTLIHQDPQTLKRILYRDYRLIFELNSVEIPLKILNRQYLNR